MWGRRWLERVAQDVRYALRIFRRNPGFASVAILSLALGIGANTALFQVLDALRLRALPVADPSTLVEVRIVDMDGARGFFETWNPTVTQPIWRAIESRQQAVAGRGPDKGRSVKLGQLGHPSNVSYRHPISRFQEPSPFVAPFANPLRSRGFNVVAK